MQLNWWMVHLQVEQSRLLMHFYGKSRNIIHLECKHFSTPSIPFPSTLLCCRLTAAGSVSPKYSVIIAWCRSCCLNRKMVWFSLFRLYHDQIIDKIIRMSHCYPGLVKNDYSQVDFINNDFRSLLSAGPLITHCSKTVTLWRGEL